MSVWTFAYGPSFTYRRALDRARVDCGAGFPKTATFSPLVSRADGTGSVSAYRGQNIFGVHINNVDTTVARNIYDFLQARRDAGDEAFQFYWVEEGPVDGTGVATTGMYWVKWLGEFEDVITPASATKHHSMDLVFEEDLSAY